jgi:hypothetical protein
VHKLAILPKYSTLEFGEEGLAWYSATLFVLESPT